MTVPYDKDRWIGRARDALKAVPCEQCGAAVGDPCRDKQTGEALGVNRAHIGRMSDYVQYVKREGVPE